MMLPRNAGSWPGYVFTGDPLHLPPAISEWATAAAPTLQMSIT